MTATALSRSYPVVSRLPDGSHTTGRGVARGWERSGGGARVRRCLHVRAVGPGFPLADWKGGGPTTLMLPVAIAACLMRAKSTAGAASPG